MMGPASSLEVDDVIYISEVRYVVTDLIKMKGRNGGTVKVWFKEATPDIPEEPVLRVIHLPADLPMERFRHGKEVHLHFEVYNPVPYSETSLGPFHRALEMVGRPYPTPYEGDTRRR